MSDSTFSLFLHGNAKLVDIADREWQLEKLDLDDIVIDKEHQPVETNDSHDDEHSGPDANKWQDVDGAFLDDYHFREVAGNASSTLQHSTVAAGSNS
ncbi:hypothetical protein BASA50_002048 [Batrachochytrium salamandrivorans]|uniref:Anaphase-promoting complex subunit 13 n=1 Tax=Batrachochytrium salamandrivorans TaxID=1357716 RepID=A0ABQ8FM92_9FUNG|nr:hypothetical protein BASA50_002048 [Batrachochytrium salamandrivorans]